MESTIRFLILIFLCNECHGVIYYLNDTEIRRMPPIYHLEDYETCLKSPSDVYCSVKFNLVSDQPSELLHLIQEYSEHSVTHYNHTKLRYGLCVSKNCQYTYNKTLVSKQFLEECLNKTIWNKYELKTKVKNYKCYDQSDNNIKINAGDIAVGIFLLLILMFNFFGSMYESYHRTNNLEGENILICFSIQRNWNKLISSTKPSDTRLQRLKGLNGIRCIIMYGVIIVHCFWPYLIAARNTHALEWSYYSFPLHIFFNGSTAIQTYLVISGFLLAYKMELHSESHPLSWHLIPKGIFLRYLRLTPAYSVVIALTATWLKLAGPSGLWEVSGQVAMSDCQNRWWINLLYLNNYVYDSQCVLQSWYLAVDMQMFCFGLILCVLLKNSNYRNSILFTLLIIGMILCAIHTYIRDLHALLLITPGDARSIFKVEPTFNETYKMGHTNISSFIVGIYLGYLVYTWQQRHVNIRRFRKYRIVYWALLPIAVGLIVSGSVFYRDAPRDPIYIRVLYAMFIRPVFGIITALFLFGMIFRIENTYRSFLEWKVWSIPSKLSYSVFIIHVMYLRLYVDMQSNLLYFTHYNMVCIAYFWIFGIKLLLATCLTTLSLLSSIPMWLFVEAPFVEITKFFTSSTQQKEKEVLNIENHGTIKNSDTYL